MAVACLNGARESCDRDTRDLCGVRGAFGNPAMTCTQLVMAVYPSLTRIWDALWPVRKRCARERTKEGDWKMRGGLVYRARCAGALQTASET
jgi:hypothetical protein